MTTIEQQEKQALKQFLTDNAEVKGKIRISLDEDESDFNRPLNIYNAKIVGSDEVQTYIVSSDTDGLFEAVKDSLQDLRDTISGQEWRDNVLSYVSGADENDSLSDVTQAVIDEYGYGHELGDYDNKTHEEVVNGKTFYIIRKY